MTFSEDIWGGLVDGFGSLIAFVIVVVIGLITIGVLAFVRAAYYIAVIGGSVVVVLAALKLFGVI
jgi:hypothetical protein